MELIQISPLRDLLSHFRFHLTLRSEEGHYHPLILFRLAPNQDIEPALADHLIGSTISPSSAAGVRVASNDRQIYVMEASCPHLGADMSHADIEECDSGIIAVCPWHRYDFNLKTGKSETGLKACTYGVQIKRDPLDGLEKVLIEAPEGGRNWRLIELRPVSEEFADPPPASPVRYVPQVLQPPQPQEGEPIVPLTGAPTTLIQWAVLILNTSDPTVKVARTKHAAHLFFTGKLPSVGNKSANPPQPPAIPPRETYFARNTVDPSQIKIRKNRALMLHALANIEQWAIDLAWDIIARFGPLHRNLPPASFFDFTKMALDESKHFSLLTSRLASISPSTPYGSMPVHASLWESATVTSHSLRSRLAIIHLVHEARGLDVNPATIERFRKAGDMDTVAVMEIIHADEVTHVTTGHRWFTWICAQEGNVDPVTAFRAEVKKGWRGDVKGPFNVDDREKAGLTREFYEDLKGEMGFPAAIDQQSKQVGSAEDDLTNGVASLQVGYDS